MEVHEAIDECKRWFKHNERQKALSLELSRLARLAKTDPELARKEKRKLDSQPHVYDGARLEEAVKVLIKYIKAGGCHE